MTHSLTHHRATLLHKQEILRDARQTLKREFIGIDSVIDQVMDAISSWFLFSDMQVKPVVVNLWGMTGVGKTALVKRLAELLDFSDKFFSYDLGDEDAKSWSISRQLENLTNNVNSVPLILSFDEFQHARSLDNHGAEIDTKNLSLVWRLIDSGKIQVSRYGFSNGDIYELIQVLSHALNQGVTVENGIVTSNHDVYKKILGSDDANKNNTPENDKNVKPITFVPKSMISEIFSVSKDKFKSEYDLGNTLLKLSGRETLELLFDIYSLALSPKTVDCSKGIIFILGNLDEVYTMSGNFNTDIDPDEFHEASLKISIPDIKTALKKRFRSEQIARLGNTHIVYPAMSNQTFRDLIALELSKIQNSILEQYHVDMKFDKSIHDLIYSEGVYPTQGARPLLTTINQVVQAKLGTVFSELILKDLPATTIHWNFNQESIEVTYLNGEIKLHTMSIQQPMSLGNARKSKQDDLQSIIAVHESGHAILSAVLMRVVPEFIYSTTADSSIGGFVYTKMKWEYTSRKQILHKLAVHLGGQAAEKVIFGEDNVTNGSGQDIKSATEFVTEMLKECGMGATPAAYTVKSSNLNQLIHDSHDLINLEAEKLINSAFDLAEKTLWEYENLLINMADYLSDNRSMSKNQIIELMRVHAPEFDLNQIVEDGSQLFYRNHLKQKVRKQTQMKLEFIPSRATG